MRAFEEHLIFFRAFLGKKWYNYTCDTSSLSQYLMVLIMQVDSKERTTQRQSGVKFLWVTINGTYSFGKYESW